MAAGTKSPKRRTAFGLVADGHVHRQAGATEVLVSSTRRWALMHELRGDAPDSTADLPDPPAPVTLQCR